MVFYHRLEIPCVLLANVWVSARLGYTVGLWVYLWKRMVLGGREMELVIGGHGF